MDESIVLELAKDMEIRYAKPEDENRESDQHNYGKSQSTFGIELSAYLPDKPIARRNLRVSIQQRRDPFAPIAKRSSAPPNTERTRADSIVSDLGSATTTGDAEVSTQSIAPKAMPQTPSTDSKDKSRYPYPPSAYICLASVVDSTTVDFNRIGILYEFADYFFLAFEVSRETSPGSIVKREYDGFVPRERVGHYLKTEWALLDKCELQPGLFGTGALVTDAGSGEWSVHSARIQLMRARCLEAAKEWVNTLKASHKIDMSQVTTKGIEKHLEHRLKKARMMAATEWYAKYEASLKEGDEFMEELMVFPE